MTKEELHKWLNSAVFECTSHQEFDESGNDHRTEIWAKDGKYYKLSKCNSGYCEAWGDRGYLRGIYQPIECEKEERTRTITETIWVPVVKSEA